MRRQDVAQSIVQRRRRIRDYWAAFPTVPRLLVDHFPQEWERVRRCRFHYRVYASKDNHGEYKVTPKSCWRIPFCVACTRAWNVVHAWKALDQFGKVTPAGQPTRLCHMVFTAPLTEDGQGWGWPASHDVPKFAAVIRRVLGAMYGPGLGGLLSYQDFGERGFQKRHPHMDLTLNMRSLRDGRVGGVERFNLEGGGRARVDEWMVKYARVFQLDAQRGNPHVGRVVEGHRAYFPIMRYQVRELVDFRKIHYDTAQQTVDWIAYNGQRRARITVEQFLDRLAEYRRRLGAFGKKGDRRVELHRYFGYMAKNQIRASRAAFGGGPLDHRRGCRCTECEDWERVYEDEFGQYAPEELGLELGGE